MSSTLKIRQEKDYNAFRNHCNQMFLKLDEQKEKLIAAVNNAIDADEIENDNKRLHTIANKLTELTLKYDEVWQDVGILRNNVGSIKL